MRLMAITGSLSSDRWEQRQKNADVQRIDVNRCLIFKSEAWTSEPKRGVEWKIQKAGFAGACPKGDLPFQHHLQIHRHLARFTAAD